MSYRLKILFEINPDLGGFRDDPRAKQVAQFLIDRAVEALGVCRDEDGVSILKASMTNDDDRDGRNLLNL